MSEIEQNSGDALAPDITKISAPQASVASRLRNYFLTGLVVAGPLAITAWLIWSIVTWVDNSVRPLIPPAYRPESYLPWPIPGTGLIVAIVVFTCCAVPLSVSVPTINPPAPDNLSVCPTPISVV